MPAGNRNPAIRIPGIRIRRGPEEAMILLLLLACTIASSGGNIVAGDDTASVGTAIFSAEELLWHDLSAGFSQTRTLDVTNIGEGVLDISEASIVTDPADVYSVNFSPFSLDPGSIGSVVVTAILVEDGPTTGELRVRTSDPAAASTLFPLATD